MDLIHTVLLSQKVIQCVCNNFTRTTLKFISYGCVKLVSRNIPIFTFKTKIILLHLIAIDIQVQCNQQQCNLHHHFASNTKVEWKVSVKYVPNTFY